MYYNFIYFLNHVLRKTERTRGGEPIANPIKFRGLIGVLPVVLSKSYIEHDLRKNKIVIPFFCQPINFYKLIVRF
jgi:hypothetical protein